LAPFLGQRPVAPIVQQPVMQPVLVDGGKLVPQTTVEKLDDSCVALHGAPQSGRDLRSTRDDAPKTASATRANRSRVDQGRLALTRPPSLPGLTRQSIQLRKDFLTKKMDARVKPAHDESRRTHIRTRKRDVETCSVAAGRASDRDRFVHDRA